MQLSITYSQTFFNKTVTATSDNPFPLATSDIWLREANIQILSNPADMGDLSGQDFELSVGDVASYPFINLKDVFVKNHTSAANTKIVVNGTRMSPTQLINEGLE